MKHADFAKAGGVGTSTYSNYSSGEREPKASFLRAIHEAGADVIYILTGQRMPLGVCQERASYTPAERAAENIRDMKLSADDAALIKAMADRLNQDRT